MDIRMVLMLLAVAAVMAYTIIRSPSEADPREAIERWARGNGCTLVRFEGERFVDRLRYCISALQTIHRVTIRDAHGDEREFIIIFGDQWAGTARPTIRAIERDGR